MRQSSGAGTRCQLPVFRDHVVAAILGRDCRGAGWRLAFETNIALHCHGARAEIDMTGLIQVTFHPWLLAAAVGILGHELVRVVMAVVDGHSGAKIMLTGPIANRITTPTLIFHHVAVAGLFEWLSRIR